jgi:hypothetical protein
MEYSAYSMMVKSIALDTRQCVQSLSFSDGKQGAAEPNVNAIYANHPEFGR